MGAAAGFGVDAVNVDYTEGVTWDDTTLIEMETELLLSFGLVHEVFVDSVTVVDNAVSLILNLSLLLLGNTLEVSDVQMSALNRLLSTILPDVRSKYLAARSEHNVSTSMMSSQLLASGSIYANMHSLALHGVPVRYLSIQNVQNDLADLLCVDDLERFLDSLDLDLSGIMLLTSGSGVNGTLIKNHNVSLAVIKHISEHIDQLGFKVHQIVILVIQVVGLRQMHGAVEDSLRGLRDALLSLGDLVVEVPWDRLLGDL